METKMKKRWYHGFTWLGYMNFFFFQWVFIRLGKYREIHDIDYTHISVSLGNNLGYGGTAKCRRRYKIIGLVLPLTGWWSDYVYVFKRKEECQK